MADTLPYLSYCRSATWQARPAERFLVELPLDYTGRLVSLVSNTIEYSRYSETSEFVGAIMAQKR